MIIFCHMTGTRGSCKKAKLQAGIKPTALCSVIDKENSIESLLDLLHYIYNYYCGYAPCLPQFSCLSAEFFVTCCDHDLWLCVTWHPVTSVTPLWLCDCHMIFPMLYLSNNLKEKEKKYKYWLSHFAKSWQNSGYTLRLGWYPLLAKNRETPVVALEALL